ncbi:MAG: hypothetical protein N2235_13015 [Fischerella sp.]|nr:hypothetical protein [Fischerella sp.]
MEASGSSSQEAAAIKTMVSDEYPYPEPADAELVIILMNLPF